MELTKAEEQVIRVIWKQGKTTVKEIIDDLSDPKPAYNTISTIVRILEKKGFVDHEAAGKGYKYFTKVSQKQYAKNFMGRFMSNYFDGSFKELVSFFVKENKIDLADVEEMMQEIKKDVTKGKDNG